MRLSSCKRGNQAGCRSDNQGGNYWNDKNGHHFQNGVQDSRAHTGGRGKMRAGKPALRHTGGGRIPVHMLPRGIKYLLSHSQTLLFASAKENICIILREYGGKVNGCSQQEAQKKRQKNKIILEKLTKKRKNLARRPGGEKKGAHPRRNLPEEIRPAGIRTRGGRTAVAEETGGA